MNNHDDGDPKRLIDVSSDSSSEEALLLRSARGDGPSARSRARAAAALGLAVAGTTAALTSGTTAAAAAGSGAAKAAASGLWLKIVGAVVITGAVGGGTIAIVKSSSSTSSPPTTTTPAVVVAQASSSSSSLAAAPTVAINNTNNTLPAESAAPEPPPPPVPSTAKPNAPLPPKHVDVPPSSTTTTGTAAGGAGSDSRSGSGSGSESKSDLARELQAMNRATTALDRGNANEALAALDEYDRTFPKGSLRSEAAVVRVEALYAKGEKATARAHARDLLARDPSQPGAKRLRSIAGE